MWLIGGDHLEQRRKVIVLYILMIFSRIIIFQIRKVTNCALEDFGELEFEYRWGACNTFPFGIMLCFINNHPEIDIAIRNRECYS